MTAKGLLKKVEQLQKETDVIVIDVIDRSANGLAAINRQQLLAGKRNDGRDIFPSYLDDPYFDTRQAAQAYSDWKDRITPNPERNPGTPNLFINGYYQSSRHVDIFIDKIYYRADYKGVEIEQKYGPEINGLGGKYKTAWLDIDVRPRLQESITGATGLKFN